MNVDYTWRVIYQAVKDDNSVLIQHALDCGLDFHRYLCKEWSLPVLAARQGSLNTLKVIVNHKSFKSDPHIVWTYIETFCQSLVKGHLEIVGFLFENCPQGKFRNTWLLSGLPTQLMQAALKSGKLDCVCLVENYVGAKITSYQLAILYQNGGGGTLLSELIRDRFQNLDEVAQALATHRLHLACAMDNLELMKQEIDLHQDDWYKLHDDNKGYIQCVHCDRELRLAARKPEFCLLGRFEWPAVDESKPHHEKLDVFAVAAKFGRKNILNYLLEKAAVVNEPDFDLNAVHQNIAAIAFNYGHGDILTCVNVNEDPQQILTHLFHAARHGDESVFMYIFECYEPFSNQAILFPSEREKMMRAIDQVCRSGHLDLMKNALSKLFNKTYGQTEYKLLLTEVLRSGHPDMLLHTLNELKLCPNKVFRKNADIPILTQCAVIQCYKEAFHCWRDSEEGQQVVPIPMLEILLDKLKYATRFTVLDPSFEMLYDWLLESEVPYFTSDCPNDLQEYVLFVKDVIELLEKYGWKFTEKQGKKLMRDFVRQKLNVFGAAKVLYAVNRFDAADILPNGYIANAAWFELRTFNRFDRVQFLRDFFIGICGSRRRVFSCPGLCDYLHQGISRIFIARTIIRTLFINFIRLIGVNIKDREYENGSVFPKNWLYREPVLTLKEQARIAVHRLVRTEPGYKPDLLRQLDIPKCLIEYLLFDEEYGRKWQCYEESAHVDYPLHEEILEKSYNIQWKNHFRYPFIDKGRPDDDDDFETPGILQILQQFL